MKQRSAVSPLLMLISTARTGDKILPTCKLTKQWLTFFSHTRKVVGSEYLNSDCFSHRPSIVRFLSEENGQNFYLILDDRNAFTVGKFNIDSDYKWLLEGKIAPLFEPTTHMNILWCQQNVILILREMHKRTVGQRIQRSLDERRGPHKCPPWTADLFKVDFYERREVSKQVCRAGCMTRIQNPESEWPLSNSRHQEGRLTGSSDKDVMTDWMLTYGCFG